MDEPARIGPDPGTRDVATGQETAVAADVQGPTHGKSTTNDPAPTEARSREKRVEVRKEGDTWVLEHNGRQEVRREHAAREKAVARARSLAQERKALLVIYDEEGLIEEQQDYGTMGVRPNPEADVTGEKGIEATARAEQRTMRRG